MKSIMPKTRMRLTVRNLAALHMGNAHSKVFDALGGSVGSSSVCTWRLEASGRQIAPLHMEIAYRDGQYVVIDACGATYLNGVRGPLGRGRGVGLSDGVCLQVGPYVLTVTLLSDEDGSTTNPFDQEESIDALLERWGRMGGSKLDPDSELF